PGRSQRRARLDLAQLLLVGLAHPLEQVDRLARLLLVDPLEGEADVDQHPATQFDPGTQRVGPDAPYAGDLGLRECRFRVDDLDDLGGNRQAHPPTLAEVPPARNGERARILCGKPAPRAPCAYRW